MMVDENAAVRWSVARFLAPSGHAGLVGLCEGLGLNIRHKAEVLSVCASVFSFVDVHGKTVMIHSYLSHTGEWSTSGLVWGVKNTSDRGVALDGIGEIRDMIRNLVFEAEKGQ